MSPSQLLELAKITPNQGDLLFLAPSLDLLLSFKCFGHVVKGFVIDEFHRQPPFRVHGSLTVPVLIQPVCEVIRAAGVKAAIGTLQNIHITSGISDLMQFIEVGFIRYPIVHRLDRQWTTVRLFTIFPTGG